MMTPNIKTEVFIVTRESYSKDQSTGKVVEIANYHALCSFDNVPFCMVPDNLFFQ